MKELMDTIKEFQGDDKALVIGSLTAIGLLSLVILKAEAVQILMPIITGLAGFVTGSKRNGGPK